MSTEAKQVLGYASEEADRLAHKQIGTEHLFFGLLKEPNCMAAKMLKARGGDLNIVRLVIFQEIGTANDKKDCSEQ